MRTPAADTRRFRAQPICMAVLRASVFGLAALSLAVTATVWDAEAGTAAAAHDPVRLNASIQVTSDTVTLGDVFQNAGPYADRVIARAPVPGQSVTLEARWLGRVARAFGLQWRPTSRYENTRVTRLSHTLQSDVIGLQVRAEVLAQRTDLAPEDIEVQLDNRFLTLTLPADKPATLAVNHLQIDPRTDRFSATLASPAKPPFAIQVPVTGQIHRTVEVPVPAGRLLRGEHLSASDFTLVRMRRNQMPANAVLALEDLLGQTAKQSLAAGKPVAANAIQPPVLVKKGSIVTVKLVGPNMLLTARGRALQSGGMDDVIRVQNRQSNRTFDALITGPGQAEISLPSQVALQ